MQFRNSALFDVNILFDHMPEETPHSRFSHSFYLEFAIENHKRRYFGLKLN
jgi:hypothetical protein